MLEYRNGSTPEQATGLGDMGKFGETIRQLRKAQNLGLRETANLVEISAFEDAIGCFA